MKITSSKNDLETLRFLWDKWKHHDSLCYQRMVVFWVIQGVIGGVTAIVWRLDISDQPKMIASLIICLIVGTFGILLYKMLKTDLCVRNTFNKSIINLI